MHHVGGEALQDAIHGMLARLLVTILRRTRRPLNPPYNYRGVYPLEHGHARPAPAPQIRPAQEGVVPARAEVANVVPGAALLTHEVVRVDQEAVSEIGRKAQADVEDSHRTSAQARWLVRLRNPPVDQRASGFVFDSREEHRSADPVGRERRRRIRLYQIPAPSPSVTGPDLFSRSRTASRRWPVSLVRKGGNRKEGRKPLALGRARLSATRTGGGNSTRRPSVWAVSRRSAKGTKLTAESQGRRRLSAAPPSPSGSGDGVGRKRQCLGLVAGVERGARRVELFVSPDASGPTPVGKELPRQGPDQLNRRA